MAITNAIGDPEIVRFIPNIPVPYAMRNAEEWFEAVTRRWREGDAERTFALVDIVSDELVGMLSIRAYEGGSLGYWLAPSARGRGLMTEAVRAVVRWAMTDLGLRHITLTTHPDNEASQQVALRAGFTSVGMLEDQLPAFCDGTARRALFEIRSDRQHAAAATAR